MLTYLKINNAAIISQVEINFDDGLNVITGETGAGKSIIIASLNFVLGGKISKSLIRNGTNFISVEALFCSPFSANVLAVLKELDIDVDDEILIKRKMTLDGKNEVKVNGCTVTTTMLKLLTTLLIDIHGQHEHQSLLLEKNHLSVLDNLGHNEILGLLLPLKSNLEVLQQINRKLKSIGSSAQNRERMLDLLSYQIDEIEQANLKENEDEDLQNKKIKMANSQKIASGLQDAYESLDGNFDANAVQKIKNSCNLLNGITKFDENLLVLKDRLDSAKLEILDIANTLKQNLDDCVFDENEFEQIDARLDKIKMLKKKYGSTLQEVFEFLERSKKEFEDLKNSEAQMAKLDEEKLLILKSLYDCANQVSFFRRKLAKEFENSVLQQLKDLGMKNAKFVVEFFEQPNFENFENKINALGFDDIKFMFSANLGQPLKPLSEIISGGECSRFMLGIKNILADNDQIGTLIFDEIDTGISGEMGFVVAQKLANISKNHQVISISHLPQICAMADTRFMVTKYTEDEQTKSKIEKLNINSSLSEIARLSGGECGSNATIEHARELKARCDNYKQQI